MSKQNGFAYIAIFIPVVVSWTIDLPEIRRHLFDNNEKRGSDNFGVRGQFFYDNIDGNSMHNSKEDHLKNANGFGYEFDMEQKVASIAKDGGRYLEGLRRSIESYIGVLTNCTRMNFTLSLNTTSNSTWLPRLEPPDGKVSEGRPPSCEEVTRAGEHVRRLAELAMWATRRLEDLAYAELYQKDVSEEEDELIFRLASFLDKLAQLTGFRPNPKKFLEDPPVSTTTQPLVIANALANPVGAPEDVKNALIKCLKQESPEPATVRCAYPLPLPPAIAAIFNITNTTSSPATGSPTADEQEQSLELLMGSDSTFTGPDIGNLPPKSLPFDPSASPTAFSPYLGISKRSLNTHLHPTKKMVKKRSIDENPTINLMKYYVKHHMWTNSNPSKNNLEVLKSDNHEVKNDLPKTVKKRSLFHRKPPHLRVPEHTLRQMKERIKATLGTHFYKNREQILKLKNTLDSIRSITYKTSLTKANIHKRSIHYENMFLPRNPEDPTQDISYYVKNKPGTNIYPSVLQAAQVRLGLEQVFQTGSIEVVRRYGANYNPLIPQPFYAGVLKSVADS